MSVTEVSAGKEKRKLELNLSELQMALEGAFPEQRNFLDLESGAVVLVTDETSRELEDIHAELPQDAVHPNCRSNSTTPIAGNDIPYFVNGMGGAVTYTFGIPVPGSVVRYNADWGAMRVDANDASITFDFVNRAGTVIDTQTLSATTTACPSMFLPLIRK